MAQTQSSSYWTGLRDGLTDLAISYGRARFIDSQTTSDELNTPDKADLNANENGRGIYQVAPGGVAVTTWLLVGAVVIAGVYVAKRVL